jgi:hypothetical protein
VDVKGRLLIKLNQNKEFPSMTTTRHWFFPRRLGEKVNPAQLCRSANTTILGSRDFEGSITAGFASRAPVGAMNSCTIGTLKPDSER